MINQPTDNDDKPYRIYTRTVFDTSYPGIAFGPDGACNLVNDFDMHVKPHRHTGPESKSHLEVMVGANARKHRRCQFLPAYQLEEAVGGI